ncbi:MAG: DHH family phosphoesterase [Porticoccaceae bacterium]|nr:DHH family phosphoesterase [Porticoccaceae bacterium]MDG1312164.1 DHH family phosphoesterase [Porticoccaceae bacterium]
MTNYDIFNGDADGICALLQLRLAEPREAKLVTGVKRDINLLKRVQAEASDRLTVLDISMDKNHEDLKRVLNAGAEVFYVDHHFAGEVPASASLKSMINEAPDVCTSLLVNHYLRGAHIAWGIVGTFGDNLSKSAKGMAKNHSLTAEQLQLLENLGIYINYNGYGSALAELHFNPAELYQLAAEYADPLDFIVDGAEHFQRLETGYHQDLSSAQGVEALIASDTTAVFELPDAPWARRVSGVYSNDLTNQNPDRGHAVLTAKANGNYLVSVRAPLNNKQGAATLCRQFPTGGGREAAAGINDLPADMLGAFIDAFKQAYP